MLIMGRYDSLLRRNFKAPLGSVHSDPARREGHWVEADNTEFVPESAIDREPFYQDQWFVRDHLGNVRSVINLTRSATMPADSVILEQNDYLPYGTKSSTSSLSTDSAFRYRYAGKEEQRFGGFDSQLLDFGARCYDPWTCQWTAVDPMAEKYAGMSPYVYCAGNPILLADPNVASPKDKKLPSG